ncbi:integration host factor subunit beta [Sedimenticola selenatireducens]|uniref:Integration host factor subunit beta n=1 Tax=Sedimenticola selenatireducens TaxID=191960 RepID=A0A558DZH2_9GAMM|nr:integration host factor subunit beta [Sedimenticola selenatireducens]TVO68589.1 integration host factor subunit beta [Sedimenticola selenatireducens]TVT66495.1 MAG: integration host factor subunit beta [Sedimenticola selenatireducens]
MKDKPDTTNTVSDRALEMIMRDVLDGLFELSLESSFTAHCNDVEILEIRQDQVTCEENRAQKSEQQNAEILEFPGLKRAYG